MAKIAEAAQRSDDVTVTKQELWEARESQGDFQHEVFLEPEISGSDLHVKPCQKNPGHANFIPATQFNMEHLPTRYHGNPDIVELVKAQCDVTCCIKIRHVSWRRPAVFPDTGTPYPFYKYRGRTNLCRTGTGWVDQVRIITDEGLDEGLLKLFYRPCPCEVCKRSGEPVRAWAEITVLTATHLVHDETEARRSTCYFFYNDSHTKMADCPSVSGSTNVDSYSDGDSIEIVCTTHDLQLARRLMPMVRLYQELCGKIAQKYGPNGVGISASLHTTKTNSDGNPRADGVVSERGVDSDGDEDSGQGKRKNGDNSAERECDGQAQQGVTASDHEALFYNSDHPLVVITSHPHGCSKVVTVGEVAQRKPDKVTPGLSSYIYSTPTCPGSSGAPVFVLGRQTGWTRHPHSGGTGARGVRQLNMSGLGGDGSDLTPEDLDSKDEVEDDRSAGLPRVKLKDIAQFL